MHKKIIWRPEEYYELSFAQDIAASQFLKVLQIAHNSDILDIGCGNGKISATLAKIAHQGSVLGIDTSSEMVEFATQKFHQETYGNLQFKIQDALELPYENAFDMVFSSFALQWIEDKDRFFQNAHRSLREKGHLALIVPLNISLELEAAIAVVVNFSEWKDFFVGFRPNWFFCSIDAIKQTLEKTHFEIDSIHSIIQEVPFPSRKALETYILLWFPYLDLLPEDLKSIFFQAVLDEYFNLVPAKLNGATCLRIPRLDLVAKKYG